MSEQERWTIWRWPREPWSIGEGSLRDNGCDHSPRSVADPFEVMRVAEFEQAIADTRADVTEAFDAIDAYAEKDLDHELHSIVEHYRGALGVKAEPPNPDAPPEPTGRPSRGRNER